MQTFVKDLIMTLNVVRNIYYHLLELSLYVFYKQLFNFVILTLNISVKININFRVQKTIAQIYLF